MKYIIKNMDYTGCDPAISEHLKTGKAVRCNCYDYTGEGHREKWVVGYTGASYLTDCGAYKFAIPIEKKRKAKKFVEIAQWLEDNSYVCNGKGEWFYDWVSNLHHAMPVYPSHLFCYCGREIPDGVFFPEEWLA